MLDEKELYKTSKSKSFIINVMFMTATASFNNDPQQK